MIPQVGDSLLRSDSKDGEEQDADEDAAHDQEPTIDRGDLVLLWFAVAAMRTHGPSIREYFSGS